jgi:hypothetical protein
MKTMTRIFCKTLNIRSVPLFLVILLTAFSCEVGATQPQGTEGAISEPASNRTQAASESMPAKVSQQNSDGLIDACSLLTKEEVEKATGRQVLAPLQEKVGNLATCYYGNPESPVINNRPLDSFIKVSLMVGIEGQYYAGPVAQARDTYEMAKKNAASAQVVGELGDDAYWDETFKSLNVLRGRYMLDISVSAEVGGIDVAKGVAAKILQRLP